MHNNMTVEKLERVLWRVRKIRPNTNIVLWLELKQAIMKEIGTDDRTYRSNVKALRTLRWIATQDSYHVELTGLDLE